MSRLADEKVKVGVIGTSWFADLTHLPILSDYDRVLLTAICGRNRERTDEMAAKYSVPQTYADYRQMIDEAHLDAVVVASPDDLHYEMVMAALDAGLHVLCEKPVALNADHAKAMYDRAEAAGIKHMVNFTYRWVPSFRWAKQLLDDGYLGQMFHGNLQYIAGYARSKSYSWRFDGNRANGAVGDIGSHVIDLARWYMGDIASVSAHLSNFVDRVDKDERPVRPSNDSAMLTLGFVSGAHAVIQISAVAHVGAQGQDQAVALHGEKGTLKFQFNLGNPQYLVRGVHGEEEVLSSIDIPQPLLEGMNEDAPFGMFYEQSIGPRLFIDCILDDKPVEPSLYDGYKAQQVIDAAFQSNRTGCKVIIP
jgi:predicted dehydrogenase